MRSRSVLSLLLNITEVYRQGVADSIGADIAGVESLGLNLTASGRVSLELKDVDLLLAVGASIIVIVI